MWTGRNTEASLISDMLCDFLKSKFVDPAAKRSNSEAAGTWASDIMVSVMITEPHYCDSFLSEPYSLQETKLSGRVEG